MVSCWSPKPLLRVRISSFVPQLPGWLNWLQRLPCKQVFIGSNPVLGAKKYSSIVQWIRIGDYGSPDRGSNPFGTT